MSENGKYIGLDSKTSKKPDYFYKLICSTELNKGQNYNVA